jgi:exodeoxyribonuclease V gamma subunit
MLYSFVQPGKQRGVDPWSIEYLTMAVLHVISGRSEYDAIIRKHGGPLQAARMLADRFDKYHARRPMMIRSWEKGSPVLAPSTADSFNDGEWRAAGIESEMWQFNLWREVRELIGVPSRPAQVEAAVQQLRRGENLHGVPPRVMVAGLQSLQLGSLEILQALGAVSDVRVVLVHPSPVLAARWSEEFLDTPVTRGALQIRPTEGDVPSDVDPLINSWLRGAREMQQMLASQGVKAALHKPKELGVGGAAPSFLQRLQLSVTSRGDVAESQASAADASVQIHRCHNLGRQVDALHDALMHAFRDVKNLQPHEVVVLSPKIDEAAPLLEAVFNREIVTAGGVKVKIPFVVADRSLRDVSEGAALLGSLLALMNSRFSVSGLLEVASSPLVLSHVGLYEDDLDTWKRHIARTRVRWGLDSTQRKAAGLDAVDENAHTWKQAIERALMGAALPDAALARELGGVVPLVDVGIEDIDALSGLAQVLHAIGELETSIRSGAEFGVAEWCDALERALVQLCGIENSELDFPLEALGGLRRSVAIPSAVEGAAPVVVSAAVGFGDFSAIVEDLLSGAPGRQPLRTGAVTATSFLPLRSVPFRVVCVVGLDDGVFGAGELESDDLVGAQQFIGDDDPRIDSRRVLLDAVLAAKDRVIITCNGRSIHNNSPVPLTTALAEFVDFCQRAGVNNRPKGEDGTEIEYMHPRHLSGGRNFIEGGVVPGVVWSHNAAAKATAENVGRSRVAGTAAVAIGAMAGASVVELSELESFFTRPLRTFVRGVMGISTWRDKPIDDTATLPLSLEKKIRQELTRGLVEGKASAVSGWSRSDYFAIARLNGDLPIGVYSDAELEAIGALADSIDRACDANGVAVLAPLPFAVDMPLLPGVVLRGLVSGVQMGDGMVTVVRYDKEYKDDHLVVAVRLLALLAAGTGIRRAITIHPSKDEPTKVIVRQLILADDIDESEAMSRLRVVYNAYLKAHQHPFGSFGGAARAIFPKAGEVALDKGRSKFQSAVSGDYFASSEEAVIYGLSPVFEEVFSKGSEMLAFWQKLADVARIASKRKGVKKGISGYEVS